MWGGLAGTLLGGQMRADTETHVSGRRFVQDWCAPSPSTHTDTAVLSSPWSPVASLGGDEGLLDQGLSWLVERWCVPYQQRPPH